MLIALLTEIAPRAKQNWLGTELSLQGHHSGFAPQLPAVLLTFCKLTTSQLKNAQRPALSRVTERLEPINF
ncbi:hypothetical protein FD25_GL001461 [Levilactobacillus acidifarinae DSM 19394]|uniref:Uncharacterized protein n=1 Tax=Levilactobacillus acidifarinae DSM 19394 = JCM 15949 TaxID=1423715 RepID=A0A0R1LIE5_9LACO|nr:hypothetical protein FD25_GL001461 [Levilactobacillus acidifarinae DSM 19394]